MAEPAEAAGTRPPPAARSRACEGLRWGSGEDEADQGATEAGRGVERPRRSGAAKGNKSKQLAADLLKIYELQFS